MNYIFISYAREDRDAALSIYGLLKENGFSPWIDVESLLPGQEWELEIDKAIRNSIIFIACLSKSAVSKLGRPNWPSTVARFLDPPIFNLASVVSWLQAILRGPKIGQRFGAILGRFRHPMSKRGIVQSELRKALTVLETIPEGEVFLIPVRLDPCDVPTQLAHHHWVDYFPEDGPDVLVQAVLQHFTTAAESPSQKIESKTLSFANIAIDGSDLNWIEVPERVRNSPFTISCSQYFQLKEFVNSANLSLDVTVINVTNDPIILTAIGIEIVSVAQRMYFAGAPEAAKIYKSESYTIELPNIKQRLAAHYFDDDKAGRVRFDGYDHMSPVDLHEVVATRVEDPVYLEAKAPYRYRLFINEYQECMPNHAILRLWARTNLGEEQSEAIELFTF